MKLLTALIIAGAAGALAQAPLPPGHRPAALLTNSATLAVAVLPEPPATNRLPFRLLARESNGWTLLSIVTTTNILRCHIAMSTNADFAVTNAELNVEFTGWPQTQHVPGFAVNDGASPFVPPKQMFYRVTIVK